MSNSDDDDNDLLALDLDDNQLEITKQKQDDDISLKPTSVSQHLFDKNDEILSTFSNKPISDSEKTALDELFANDDEDEEDEFIKSQSILISSTQVTKSNKSPLKELHVNSEELLEEPITKKTSVDQVFLKPLSPAITSQNQKQISPRNADKSNLGYIHGKTKEKFINPAKSNELAMLEMLANNKTWTFALNDLKNMFRFSGLESSLVTSYSLNYYYKKFFEYDLLMRSNERGVRKIPLLCVWVKEITRKTTSATVLLTDFSSDIKGTIMNSFLKDKTNWSYLMIGSVLFIKDVYLLQVNHNKNCYHLNINLKNIICIYYPNLDETTGSIKKIDVQTFDSLKIRQFIDEFENNYTNYEYVPPMPNESIVNKTTGNKKFNNSKSAPYQIPSYVNSKDAQRNNADSITRNALTKNNDIQNSRNSHGYLSKLKSVNQTNIVRSVQTNSESQPRNSQLINSTNDEVKPKSNLTIENQMDSTLELNNLNDSKIFVVNSTQKSSQDIFSQLIFGIEDEFLNDDD